MPLAVLPAQQNNKPHLSGKLNALQLSTLRSAVMLAEITARSKPEMGSQNGPRELQELRRTNVCLDQKPAPKTTKAGNPSK
jgi:hypothetical protein